MPISRTTVEIAILIENDRSLKLRQDNATSTSPAASTKPPANEGHPAPGEFREGLEWAGRRGERLEKRRRGRRSARSPGKQHHPLPPYQLTPHPHLLGHHGGGCHHPLPPSCTIILHDMPETEHVCSVSGFGPTPLPASHFASAQPHCHHHHLVRTTTPPLHTIPCRHFTRHTLN